MPTLLYISISPRGNFSISRQIGDAAVEAWKARNPEGRVIERDLAKTRLRLLTSIGFQAPSLRPSVTTKTIREQSRSPTNWWQNWLPPMKSLLQLPCTTSQFQPL